MPRKGYKQTEEHKKRVSDAKKGQHYNIGEDNPMHGKAFGWRIRGKNPMLGQKHSEETKRKIGKANQKQRGGTSTSALNAYARKVWEKHHSYLIPKGFLIHHGDGNIANNSIDNLVLLTSSHHQKIHKQWLR